MELINEPPPQDVQDQLVALRAALDEVVPVRAVDRNLLVATWNLRAFGDMTEKWHSQAGDSPKRDVTSVLCIAEIVKRFDVVAIQEVRGAIKSLRHMLKALGPDWGVILTDTTKGSDGNDERMAFVFDTRRVKPSGLACELVVPVEKAAVEPDAFNRQFARTPYAVSFLSGGSTFILVTLHVIYGKDPSDRVGELKAIAGWLSGWAQDEDDYGHNLIALGDFNIDRRGDPLYEAFTSTGLTPPEALNAVPRTIFDHPEKPHHYDQIAWFTGEGGAPKLSLEYTGKAGTFNFPAVVMPGLEKTDLSWRISDHFPLWVEFALDKT